MLPAEAVGPRQGAHGRLPLKRAIYTFLIACGGHAQEPPQNVTALPQPDASTVVEARDAEARDVETRDTSTSTSTSHDAGAHGPETAVAMMRGGLRRCWNAAVKNDPKLRATLKLTIDVAPDGSVTKVTPHSTPPVPSDLEQCLVAVASKVAFDPPGGNGAVFELPINLVPSTP